MRILPVGMVLAGALSLVAAPSATQAQTLVVPVSAGQTGSDVRTLLRFEDAPLMLESLKALALDYLAGELATDFKDTMGPELDRFRSALDARMKIDAETAGIEADVASLAPKDAAIVPEAEAVLSEQRQKWQAQEAAGKAQAFLAETAAAYEARADKGAIDRLVDLRVAVVFAEQNTRALAVFTRIVQSVLAEGTGALDKIPDGEWQAGIEQAYTTAGDAGNPRNALSRDVERNRQRILLTSLDADQVDRLLAFYESAEGKAWSQAVARAYEKRMRALTADITTAYVDAVKQREH